jgi:hypothetical protein
MTDQTPKHRIPEFKSIEEEAEFWDTHDTADFEDEFKPVEVRFEPNLSEGITVRFDAATLEKLRSEARKKGIGPAALLRLWALKRLG